MKPQLIGAVVGALVMTPIGHSAIKSLFGSAPDSAVVKKGGKFVYMATAIVLGAVMGYTLVEIAKDIKSSMSANGNFSK
jgi:hypothetical protein